MKNETQEDCDTCDSGTRPWSAWARCWREWGTLGSAAACAKSWAWGTQYRLARAPPPAQPCTSHTCQRQGGDCACWCSHCCSLCDAEPQPSPFLCFSNSPIKKKQFESYLFCGYFGFWELKVKDSIFGLVKSVLEVGNTQEAYWWRLKPKMFKGYACIILLIHTHSLCYWLVKL